MPGTDIANMHAFGQTVSPAAAITATATGSGVDFRDCSPDVTAIFSFSTVQAEEDATATVTLQESKNDNTADASGAAEAYAALSPAAAMTLVNASTSGNVAAATFFNRQKRYVRGLITIAGTSPDIFVSLVLMCRKTSY